MYNFDRIQLTYFFDESIMLQALRAGVFDYYREQNEKSFHTAYDFVGRRKGLFKAETYTMGGAYGMHFGVVLNMRRPAIRGHPGTGSPRFGLQLRVGQPRLLAQRIEAQQFVFRALGIAGQGIAVGGRTGAMLEPFRDQLPERVFTQPVPLPENEPFGRNRDTLLQC